jgi:hypothetical protein
VDFGSGIGVYEGVGVGEGMGGGMDGGVDECMSVSDAYLRHLGPAASAHVRALRLDHKGMNDELLLRLVQSFSSLSHLHLYLLTDRHMPALVQLLVHMKARLHAVYLHQARMSSHLAVDLIEAIVSQAQLRVVCLKGVRLASDSVFLLASLVVGQRSGESGLERLELHSNWMDDDLCALLFDASLRTCQRLHSLVIQNNRVGGRACGTLASAVQKNNTLQRSLRCLAIRGSAALNAGLVQLSAATATLLQLEHFDISESSVDEHGMAALSEVLHATVQLSKLDCVDCSLRCSSAVLLFEALHAHPQLRALNVSHNSLGPQLHTSLSRLLVRPPPHLQVLKLERVSLDASCWDWSVAMALSMLHLRELHLSANRIGQQGAAMLAEALTGCTRRFAEHLATLQPRPFEPTDCAWLDKSSVASLRDLKVLNVSENRLLGVGGMMILWALQWRSRELDLKHLDVSNNLFGGWHAHIRSGLKELVAHLACSNSSENQILDATNQV